MAECGPGVLKTIRCIVCPTGCEIQVREVNGEITYEGYAPHGVALLVETATDNATRTVANVRMHFTKSGGSLGTSGSVAFTFNRLGEFKVKNSGLNIEELELELLI